MKSKEGKLIYIDGPCGVSKGTLISNVLKTWDVDNNGPVTSYYDPGIKDGHNMNVIRNIIKTTDLSSEAELLLIQACRVELFKYIKESIDNGVNVLCDRGWLSTLIYQGKLKGLEDLVYNLHYMFKTMNPDITIILQAPFEVVTERLKGRFKTNNPNNDKFKVNDDFRKKVWVEYNKLVEHKDYIYGLDAIGDESQVLENFYNILKDKSIILSK